MVRKISDTFWGIGEKVDNRSRFSSAKLKQKFLYLLWRIKARFGICTYVGRQMWEVGGLIPGISIFFKQYFVCFCFSSSDFLCYFLNNFFFIFFFFSVVFFLLFRFFFFVLALLPMLIFLLFIWTSYATSPYK